MVLKKWKMRTAQLQKLLYPNQGGLFRGSFWGGGGTPLFKTR